MTVLDAYAVVAALVGERAREVVEPLLADAAISSVNLAEVIDVCVRVHRNPSATVRERIDWLIAGGLEVVATDADQATTAGMMRARRYQKRDCEISLADCFAAALAASRQAPLGTADPHLAQAAWTEGLQIIALPDSRGHRPQRS